MCFKCIGKEKQRLTELNPEMTRMICPACRIKWPLENYNVDRSQNATVENFNNIKALYNVYIARGYWKTIFNK